MVESAKIDGRYFSPEINAEKWQTLHSKTASALAILGIKLDRKIENDAMLISQMMPYVLDHGSMNPLPGHSYLPKIDRNEDDLEYDNRILESIPVYSSVMAKLILSGRKDYEALWVDGENIYSANRVSQLEGNRVIRKSISDIQSQIPESLIFRFDGDGFFVARKKSKKAKLFADVYGAIERLDGDQIRLQAVASLYKIAEDLIALRPARLHLKSSTDSLLTERFSYKGDLIEKRIIRLINHHPELSRALELIKGKKPAEQDTLLTIIEGSVFDPILQTIAERVSDKENRKVEVFRDAYDYSEHLAGREVHLVKFDFTSVLKSLNDDFKGGYFAGNAYLEEMYSQIIGKIIKSFFENGQGEHPQGSFRRWGDLYVEFDAGINPEKIKEEFTTFFVANRYLKVKKTDNGHQSFVGEFCLDPGEDEGDLIIPLLPVVAITENLRFEATHVDEKDRSAAQNRNLSRLGTALGRLEEKAQAGKTSVIEERLQDPRCNRHDVLFICNHTLNAWDEKRGLPRLTDDFGATTEEIDQIKQHYHSHAVFEGKHIVNNGEKNINELRNIILGIISRLNKEQ